MKEYWGKMMRGACLVYQCAPDDALYSVTREEFEAAYDRT